jgi:hypothetical protein
MKKTLVTPQEIKDAGFSWPPSETIKECLVREGEKIDLTATHEALLQKKAYWNRQYAEARSMIRSGAFRGAMSADEITDADTYAEQCDYAARHIEKMIRTIDKS